MNAGAIMGVSLVGLCLAFAACRILAGRIDNYGIVDVAWSYGFSAVALLCGILGEGWAPRREWIAAMALIWSLRLGTHLLVRIAKHHPREDSRYGQLRRDWGAAFGSRMTGFFQAQAVSVTVLGAPFYAACANPRPGVRPAEIGGAALWLIGICGEALADAQLAAFRGNAANRGRVCDGGLWRFSRHPNYFFEWVIWVGYFAFACGSPWGWVSVLCPACILYLLLFATGVPTAERQSLLSKGDAYRRYQESTHAFFPWIPKQARQT